MSSILLRIYDKFVLARPVRALLLTVAVIGFFAWHVPQFKLDASGDSLVLENDRDLYYHRQITERYGSKDVLLLAYVPKADLFAPVVLADLKSLRDELARLAGVEAVTTILDIPLLYTTDLSLSDVAEVAKIKTLEKSAVPKELVLRELHENPLYKGRLLGPDDKTTALLLILPDDPVYRSLLNRRYELREKKYRGEISQTETMELAEVSAKYRARLTILQHEEERLVEMVREVMARHLGQADLYLGGVPMIVADMISFIENDLVVFGVGVLVFLIITLSVIFRKKRWVFLSMFCCGAAVLTMIGYLGLMDWRVTVISSNFISLMLILTMALTIHLTERYLEIHARTPEAEQRALVLETVRTIALPCFYTVLTTAVAFGSLLVSGIRPVIDFGMMMAMGLVVSFVLAFVLFPASVVLLKKDTSGAGEDFSKPFTLIFAGITERHGGKILLFCVFLAVLSGFGMERLNVENRFIDYFRQKTEIFRGMSLIDQKLGGTTPFDLIIDFRREVEPDNVLPDEEATGEAADQFDQEYLFDQEEEEANVSYWFGDVYTMEQIEKIHDYLDGLPETGEVLSLATLGKVTTRLNGNMPLENYELSILHKKMPGAIKELLVEPFVTADLTQTRFTMRIVETGHNMARDVLMSGIRDFLVREMGFADEQIHFTNMFVLYNNMLQSLFHSQIMTIGIVFLGIMLMFLILFRSFYLALIAIIPNVLPVAVILGSMGWFGIPLDMMTITIASITIGISVDDTIHYIHRFQHEFPKDRNYLATVYRCHRSIGRAMYYTTVTIIIGFAILVLSNFIPTIYFGLFTGFAMLVALLGDLIMLPKLLMLFKPLGPGTQSER
ncbi:MAG: MMPL family transporter [Proteobacteria bacterium]|nr:MMPL family transporter [Pseudomonadota bacterium]MBU1714581.1 MMPL family transporter [Pseudomonadota bacterium]